MKKMFKTAASLAVGCALLSTSAFAALTGEVTKDETGAVVALNGYAAKAQSTILVVKGETELEAIPADLADGAIAYINQAEATDGTINYDVNVTGDGTYTVFAGGSDQDAATKIGAFAISSKPAGAESISIQLDGADVDNAIVNVLDTIKFSASVEGTAAGDVVWSINDETAGTIEDGLFVPAEFMNDPYDPTGIGEFEITATVDGKSDTVKLRVWRYGDVDGNGLVDSDDSLSIQYFNMYMYDEAGVLGSEYGDPYELNKSFWAEAAADVDGNEMVDSDDALNVEYYAMYMIFDLLPPQ